MIVSKRDGVGDVCPAAYLFSPSLYTLHLRAHLAMTRPAVEEHQERDRQKEDHVVGEVPVVWICIGMCIGRWRVICACLYFYGGESSCACLYFQEEG